jgi:hypothetical protein
MGTVISKRSLYLCGRPPGSIGSKLYRLLQVIVRKIEVTTHGIAGIPVDRDCRDGQRKISAMMRIKHRCPLSRIHQDVN